MSRAIQLALLADGPSDRALRHPLQWAVRQLDAGAALADWLFVPRRPPGQDLGAAVAEVLQRYRPDLLFVHRDAEGVPHATRKLEIPRVDRLVPVVPVRMTEAWLLIDEAAIRSAAGNPRGAVPLDLPRASRLEAVGDAKKQLVELLVAASGHRGRRRQQFDRAEAVQLVANHITDFSPLRDLPAFADMERELRAAWPRVVAKDAS
jgi:hypothetical protein